jgi:phosphoribosylaminoimidazole-succinocarboxamide synthase
MAAFLQTDLPVLRLLSRGKVRDVYATSSPDHLLFIATDRISVYDVILKSVGGYLNSCLSDLNIFMFFFS